MEKKYFCYKITQRDADNTVEFVVFVANADDVNNWAGIRRVGEVEYGTQRVLKQTRANAIKRFLQRNELNTIPVSVILAFNPDEVEFNSVDDRISECVEMDDIHNGIDGKGEWGVINFEYNQNVAEENRPALIVDGQHRIKGMSDFSDEKIPIVVAAFINAPPQEQAFQFVVINNKAQKVKTDNVKAIIRNIDEEQLRKRLLDAGVSYGKWSAVLGDINDSDHSPFQGLLDWPLNEHENRKVQLTTIEHCIRYINATLPVMEEDEDSRKEMFMAIWRSAKENYPNLWLNNEKFMSKVNISALHEYILDRIESAYLDGHLDIYDVDEIERYTKEKISAIPAEFWLLEWAHKLQDNAVIRGRIKDDLRKIAQNVQAGREWNDGLRLL